MKTGGLMAALVAAGFIGTTSLALAGNAAQDDFLRANPQARLFEWGGKVSRVYGPAMATGVDPETSAQAFVEAAAGVFGVDAAELVPTPTPDGLAFQPVMLDRATGDYKFFAVYYAQTRGNVPVWNSNLTVVVRNDRAAGYPVVLAVNGLHDLKGFEVPAAGVMTPNQVKGLRNAFPPVDEPAQVIFMDAAGREEARARLAYTYVSQTGRPGQPVSTGINGEPVAGTYDKRRLFVDAVTGEIIHQESLILTIDVAGNVSGNATPGLAPDTANNLPVEAALPNVRVEIVGGSFANSDAAGDFVIPHSGGTQVTVRSRMIGPSLTRGVQDQAGAEIQIDLQVTPPGPANFLHNATPAQFTTAQVNAMLQTSLIHSRVLEINPDYPQTGRQFQANVNINSACNAYYDGPSINFYRAGGGCVNTAYSTVVHHEYGHKLVDDGGTQQGAYGEGMADCMAIVMTDDPITGLDFGGPGDHVRDARDGRQYPCSGEIHFCGQVLSGCVWDTREALVVTEPSNYRDILGDLTLNSILFRPTGIDPGITIDFLTLDDTDGEIGNGTPHYNEINQGFSAHNMDAPPLTLLEFTFPNGLPDPILPEGGTTFRVVVSSITAEPEPGTGELHYNDGSGWFSVPMVVVAENEYDAVFPPTICGQRVLFYVSALTTDDATATSPADAPASTYDATSANNVVVVFEDDFDIDRGWTVESENLTAGAWQRGVSVDGSRGAPAEDFDGSGQCFLTQNTPGDSDVDGGPTMLTSPTFDLEGLEGDATISYARWFTNDDRDIDRLRVEISDDGGANWVEVETVGHFDGWVERAFKVSEIQGISPTSEMQVRFSATDNPNDSVTEAAIDAFNVSVADCDGSSLTLTLGGDCGSTNGGTLDWSGAAPDSNLAVIFARNTGSVLIPPGNPCQGTQLGLGANQLQLAAQFDSGGGSGSRAVTFPGASCDGYLQLLQVSGCVTSNVARIPSN